MFFGSYLIKENIIAFVDQIQISDVSLEVFTFFQNWFQEGFFISDEIQTQTFLLNSVNEILKIAKENFHLNSYFYSLLHIASSDFKQVNFEKKFKIC
jgi:hypothetical protein